MYDKLPGVSLLLREVADTRCLGSAGYIPRNDLTAIACALYGVVCILLWTRTLRLAASKPYVRLKSLLCRVVAERKASMDARIDNWYNM